MSQISRRGVLAAIVGIGAAGGLAGLQLKSKPRFLGLLDIQARESKLAWNGKIRSFALNARMTQVDLGGKIASTWVYGDALPGKIIRINKNDRVKVSFKNELLVPTSVHWHGLAIRNDMDGVPGITSPEVLPGSSFNFDFITPDAGTYWFHPHSGTQLDRGLYAPLIVDDPTEITNYDREWILVLDDWTDGVGKNPDQILADLRQGNGNSSSMPGMDMGSTGGMDSGDVTYPMYLVNGRPINDPDSLTARPGERIRIRIINAGADTIFNVALAEHIMTVTHSDGFPVKPYETSLLRIGMGERYDIVVTMKDGIFPFVADPIGKSNIARALIRTGAGSAPLETFRPIELGVDPLTADRLQATKDVRLPAKKSDRTHDLVLNGSMKPYEWMINGQMYPHTKPLFTQEGEMGSLRIRNMTMMYHPIHMHGHTFQIGNAGGSGARKDTVLLPPMGGVNVDFQATNPGNWMIHCHNAYHAEAGMMTRLEYIK
jgi:FtsP/CotA-like multicopper oxidase with cupredoxin domain